jgi:DivIVA domain-containing protein
VTSQIPDDDAFDLPTMPAVVESKMIVPPAVVLRSDQVRGVRFHPAKPGYSYAQVETFVDQVTETLEFLEQQHHALERELFERRDEVYDLEESISTLKATVEVFRAKGDPVTRADGSYVTASQARGTSGAEEEITRLRQERDALVGRVGDLEQTMSLAAAELEHYRAYVEQTLLPWAAEVQATAELATARAEALTLELAAANVSDVPAPEETAVEVPAPSEPATPDGPLLEAHAQIYALQAQVQAQQAQIHAQAQTHAQIQAQMQTQIQERDQVLTMMREALQLAEVALGAADEAVADLLDAVHTAPAEDTLPEPVHSEPVHSEPVHSEHVQPEHVQPEHVQPEQVQPEPVQPEPVQPEQVQPEPVQPEPVQPAAELPGPAPEAPAVLDDALYQQRLVEALDELIDPSIAPHAAFTEDVAPDPAAPQPKTQTPLSPAQRLAASPEAAALGGVADLPSDIPPAPVTAGSTAPPDEQPRPAGAPLPRLLASAPEVLVARARQGDQGS